MLITSGGLDGQKEPLQGIKRFCHCGGHTPAGVFKDSIAPDQCVISLDM